MQQQSQLSGARVRDLILASSSPYRKHLLERLCIPFEVRVPKVDETPLAGEPPAATAERLAAAKARAVSRQAPAAVVIGSDQVAVHAGAVVGKPGTPQRARQQLQLFSGNAVEFVTAISVQCAETGLRIDRTVVTEACFRPLGPEEIRRYVDRDNPLDCAGGFRSEETGTTLLSALRSDDPTAIVGLPLIALSEALRKAGFELP